MGLCVVEGGLKGSEGRWHQSWDLHEGKMLSRWGSTFQREGAVGARPGGRDDLGVLEEQKEGPWGEAKEYLPSEAKRST